MYPMNTDYVTRRLLILFVAGSFFILTGCDSGGMDAEPPDSDVVKVTDQTVVAADQGLTLISQSEGQLEFATDDESGTLEPGDIIVGEEEGGYLRRVDSVEQGEGTLRVTTSSAALTDVFERATLSPDFSDDSFERKAQEGWRVTHLAEGVKLPGGVKSFQKASGSLGIQLGNVSLTSGGEGLDVRFKEGNANFDPQLDISAEIDDRRLQTLDFSTGGSLEYTADIDVSVNSELAATAEKSLAKFQKFHFGLVGGVPVLWTWEVEFVGAANISLDASTTISTDVNVSTNAEYALIYNGEEWSTPGDQSASAEAGDLSLENEVGGAARVDIRVRGNVNLYTVAGPYASVGPYLSADLTKRSDRTEWALRGGLDTRIGVSASILDRGVADYGQTFNLTEYDIDSGSIQNDSNPTPAEPSIGWTHWGADVSGSNFVSISSTSPESDLSADWSVGLPTRDSGRILTGDVDSDQELEIVTVQGQTLYVLDPDGSVVTEASIAASGAERADVSMIDDVDGDSESEIAVSYRYNNGSYLARFYSGDGTLENELSRSNSSDGQMIPQAFENGSIFMAYDAGYAEDPRGLGRWNYALSQEEWFFDAGPRFRGFSMDDVDSDGISEVAFGTFSPHNGATGDGGTNDGSTYTIILDADGNEEIVSEYSGGSADGVLQTRLINTERGQRILSAKEYDKYYPGTSRLHIRTPDGSIEYTHEGQQEGRWFFGWADLRGDGQTHVVAANGRSGDYSLSVFDSMLNETAFTSLPGGAIFRAMADIDGDGDVEVIAAGGSDVVVYGPDLQRETSWTYSGTGSVRNAIVSDANGDGDADVVVLSDDGITVL